MQEQIPTRVFDSRVGALRQTTTLARNSLNTLPHTDSYHRDSAQLTLRGCTSAAVTSCQEPLSRPSSSQVRSLHASLLDEHRSKGAKREYAIVQEVVVHPYGPSLHDPGIIRWWLRSLCKRGWGGKDS